MVSILMNLEVRYFKARKIIIRELEEANEMYFVQNGLFDIGYEINKSKKFRM